MPLGDEAPDIERIAETIHSSYLEQHLASGHRLGSIPALVSWDELPADYRDADRAQARDILAKLASIGAHVEAARGSQVAPGFAFTAAEIDMLARREHARWRDHKLSRGWTLGPRDEARRTHPCLVPYDDLPEAERQKDSDVVVSIPSLLALSGYRIVRDCPEPGH